MPDLLLFDATLRDGSHAIKHQLTIKNVKDYCKSIDKAGMYTVFVGHGNGLGASSLQVGISLVTDHELLSAARENLKKTKLGAYLIPGFGTIRDNINPAIDDGVDVFAIGCHCTEANITRQHIEYVREKGKEAYGVLMMYHMAPLDVLIEEVAKMQTYGAQGIILMDSAGASTPERVKKTIATLKEKIDVKIGFHAHNNLGLAVANSYIAYKEGASIIDGTLRGFGAGAGNCQLEAFVALLEKNNIKNDYNLYQMLDTSEGIVKEIMQNDKGISQLSIVSGMAGVFSAFAPHVRKAAKRFKVDSRDIFRELGKRKVVAGQEDMIVEVALELSKEKIKNQNFSF